MSVSCMYRMEGNGLGGGCESGGGRLEGGGGKE